MDCELIQLIDGFFRTKVFDELVKIVTVRPDSVRTALLDLEALNEFVSEFVEFHGPITLTCQLHPS